jgi:DNA replication protein DnaC
MPDRCETCDDEGYVVVSRGGVLFGEPCPDCHDRKRQEWLARRMAQLSAECGLTEAQRAMTFEGYQQYTGNENALKAAIRFAESGLESRGWLVLAGQPGTGKSHLAAAIANTVISRGVPTLYAYVPDLLEWLRSGYRRGEDDEDGDGGFEERFERIRSAQLLILDDLGAQQNTAWVTEKLESIIDYRYRERLPMVATTNADPTRVRDLSERIYSRLERYEPHYTVIMTSLPYHLYRRQREAGR